MRKPNIIPPSFLHSHTREMKFLLWFVIILLAGHILLQITYLKIAPFLIDTLHAKVGAAVIGLISHDGSVTALNNTITSKITSMQIVKGCDGTEGLLLIVAAMFAFPASLRDKVFGFVLGILFIYTLNLLRIVGLWFVLGHAPALFDFMHVYVGQTYIILSGFLFFFWWATRGERTP